MKKTFTREEVKNILVSVQVVASGNNNQGFSSIRGNNFAEKADSIIERFELITFNKIQGLNFDILKELNEQNV